MAYINDAWLASDVIINSKFLYWPGYAEYVKDLKGKSWQEFEPVFNNAKSSFFASYAILDNRYSSPELRSVFYEARPVLVDRALDGIAAVIANRAALVSGHDNVPLDEVMREELSLFDECLHDKIKVKIKEEKWVKR